MTESLVIAPQWIGDAVMTEPLLRRLAARGERLSVAAVPWVAPVYRAMPQVGEVIELPFRHGGLHWGERRRIAREVEGRFDTAYIPPNSLKSAVLPFLARIPRRVGYLGETRVGLLTHRLPNPKAKPPMVAFYSALSGDRQGIEADVPRLHLPSDDVTRALERAGLATGGYFVFAPGAEYGPAKRWPAIHFAELAKTLDAPAVLLASAKEAPLCKEIHEEAGRDRCIDLAGKTSLADAFALISAARAVVSNDSGLMHVAAAFGVPQVAIFGSSSPRHTPPLNVRASVIWLRDDPGYEPPLDCSPCFQRECPLGHTRCLYDITPARVASLLQ
jgi:heptosyltransferase II